MNYVQISTKRDWKKYQVNFYLQTPDGSFSVGYVIERTSEIRNKRRAEIHAVYQIIPKLQTLIRELKKRI